MAKAPRPDTDETENEPVEHGPAVFVLNRTFGAIIGRTHQVFQRGTQFVVGKDNAMITALIRLGADLTEK